ncbi:peptidase M24, structural domain-containing protein [Dipodascopsis uninucleata]
MSRILISTSRYRISNVQQPIQKSLSFASKQYLRQARSLSSYLDSQCLEKLTSSISVSSFQTRCREYSTTVGFGQPIHETHPHLLKHAELTPGITAMEYHIRRHKLMEHMPLHSVAILVGADLKYRSGPVFYEFHQEPNFFYLTGFLEPKAVAVIEKADETDFIFHLIVQEKNEREELWDGPRTGTYGAKEIFNADEAGDVKYLRSYLDPIIKRASRVYMDLPSTSNAFTRFFEQQAASATNHTSIVELLKHHGKYNSLQAVKPLVHELRKIKSSAEIAVMREAGRISGKVINKAYGTPFKKEADLDAFLDYHFRIGGCEKSAYVPVVAGGAHALGIHYTRNDDIFRDGELILIDAGGQYGGYCADISRAWPVNGKFTEPQKDLYQAVLNVQKYCIDMCTTNYTLEEIQEASIRQVSIELRNIGFHATYSDISNVLYPHYIGHNLGIDVHDVPTVSKQRLLENGQVITIEPGVYVPEDSLNFPKHFRGIGIRIEDDVCINNEDPIILNVEAAKEIVDVEAACAKRFE